MRIQMTFLIVLDTTTDYFKLCISFYVTCKSNRISPIKGAVNSLSNSFQERLNNLFKVQLFCRQ